MWASKVRNMHSNENEVRQGIQKEEKKERNAAFSRNKDFEYDDLLNL